MDRQLTFEILLYLNIFYTMFYAGIETFFFFMKYIYVPDFGKTLTLGGSVLELIKMQEEPRMLRLV